MELEIKKIHFIQEFLRLNNEMIIDNLDKFMRQEKLRLYSNNLKPLTIEEFNSMIDKAEDDSRNNRLTEARQLRQEIDSWN